jgi:copper chaperone CopZ
VHRPSTSTGQESNMITSVYEVDGMNCHNCASAVGTAIRALPGVADAVVDLAARKVTVDADPQPDGQALIQAVAAAGYTLRP